MCENAYRMSWRTSLMNGFKPLTPKPEPAISVRELEQNRAEHRNGYKNTGASSGTRTIAFIQNPPDTLYELSEQIQSQRQPQAWQLYPSLSKSPLTAPKSSTDNLARVA